MHTTVYDNAEGFDHHTITCFECTFTFHFRGRYDVVVAGVDPNTVANSDLLNRGDLADKSNDGRECREINEELWNNNCFYGVHVISNGYNEVTMSNFGNRYRHYQGNEKVVVFWALAGHCDKLDAFSNINPPPQFIQQFLQ